jgi:RimJ/RimL family protein N-acetyltransferase
MNAAEKAGLEQLVVVATDRVRVRRKHRGDALDDYQWRRDPELTRFDASEPVTATFSEFLQKLEYEIAFRDPRRESFSLDAPDGTHIGNVMYYNVDYRGESAEFGISIAREAYRGQGLGTEATVLFLRHLWQTRPFRVVFLHTLEWNHRARRCFRRAGFEETVRVLRNGKWFVRMEARREWWLLWDMEGRFERHSEGAAGMASGD